jgi:hypothetical protein
VDYLRKKDHNQLWDRGSYHPDRDKLRGIGRLTNQGVDLHSH